MARDRGTRAGNDCLGLAGAVQGFSRSASSPRGTHRSNTSALRGSGPKESALDDIYALQED